MCIRKLKIEKPAKLFVEIHGLRLGCRKSLFKLVQSFDHEVFKDISEEFVSRVVITVLYFAPESRYYVHWPFKVSDAQNSILLLVFACCCNLDAVKQKRRECAWGDESGGELAVAIDGNTLLSLHKHFVQHTW